jgi:hypothetical protein
MSVHAKGSAKGAEIAGFQQEFLVLLLSSRSFWADNVLRERQALSAFWLSTQSRIDIADALRSAAHSRTQVFFADCIADTDYHRFAYYR